MDINKIKRLLLESGEHLPVSFNKARNKIIPIEGEVVGDLVTQPSKRVLKDIDGELVGQKLLSTPVEQRLLSAPVVSQVDDIIDNVNLPKKGMMDHINDLSPTKKVLTTAGLVAAASAPLFMNKSSETSEGGQSSIPAAAQPKKQALNQPIVENKQEVAKSTTTGKRSVVDNALQNKAPEIESLSNQSDTLNNALEEARQKDADQGLMFGLLKAAQMGGAAIAGSKADTSYADAQLAKPDEFVRRLKEDTDTKELEDKRNPNSKISKLMQQAILTLKPGANVEGLSAAQVEKIFPSLAQAITMQESIAARKEGIAARKETAALNREAMSIQRGDKKEMRDTEFAGKHIDTYTKMLHKDYQSLQQAETNAKRAEDIVAQNLAGITPGAGDIAILYNFVKGLDKNSAVREGEIALSKQARSVLGRLDSEIKRMSGGDILDDDTRKAFSELIRASADAEKLNFIKQKRNAIAAGTQKGIDPEMLDKAIYADISTTAKPVESTTIPSGPVEKVNVIAPNGKKGRIPRSQLDEAISKGYKEIQ